MILHDYKLIFIHIPKCAGTSIEEFFYGETLDWTKPNYRMLHGWCPKYKIHLQHLSARQMVRLKNLVPPNIWRHYTKFAVVRNPWDRAVSGYAWLKNRGYPNDSLKNFILCRGSYKDLVANPQHIDYRGEHFLTQKSFITIDGTLAVDRIIRYENLHLELNQFFKEMGISREFNIKTHRSKRTFPHYSNYYSDKCIELIRKKYQEDIQEWDYHFDDQRTFRDVLARGYHLLLRQKRRTINSLHRVKKRTHFLKG